MSPALEVQALVKTFGSVVALDGLDLEAQGPVGLLGPNGAGKTTLIQILLGLRRPTSGSVRVQGIDPTKRRGRLEVRRCVGYMPEGDCLLPDMTGLEIATTLGRLAGLRATDALSRAHEVLDYVGVEEERYRPAKDYSTGKKQRLKLAQALVHDPAVLLLDEPTNGLDPKGRVEMLDLVHDLGSVQQKHVLLCTHILPDVERTCESIVVLDRGKRVEGGRIQDLLRGPTPTFAVEWLGEGDLAALLERDGHVVHDAAPGRLRVELNGDPHIADPLFRLAREAGVLLRKVEPRLHDLHGVFLNTTGDAPELAAQSTEAQGPA